MPRASSKCVEDLLDSVVRLLAAIKAFEKAFCLGFSEVRYKCQIHIFLARTTSRIGATGKRRAVGSSWTTAGGFFHRHATSAVQFNERCAPEDARVSAHQARGSNRQPIVIHSPHAELAVMQVSRRLTSALACDNAVRSAYAPNCAFPETRLGKPNTARKCAVGAGTVQQASRLHSPGN